MTTPRVVAVGWIVVALSILVGVLLGVGRQTTANPPATFYCDTTANCLLDQKTLGPRDDLIYVPTLRPTDVFWDCRFDGGRVCP